MTSEVFDQENNLLFNTFLERYFYKDFRRGEKSIELIISPKCNLHCKYCYVVKYYNKTFEESIFNNSNLLGNLDLILNWMDKNDFVCGLDVFSGELFAQDIGYRVIDKIYDFYKKLPSERRIKRVFVPTNYTFINDDSCVERIESYICKFNEIGIRFGLSTSFDGKFMEKNRPYAKDLDIPLNFPRDETYYDKVFKLNAKYGFGFHPMIYYDNIDKWIENFDWFQSKFEEFGIDWQNIYLLQVRDDGWTKEDNKELYKFIQHIIDFSFNKLDKDKHRFLDEFLFNNSTGFNLLNTPFVTFGRGLGCSIQTNLGIRVSDLKHFPCHRTMYPDFCIGQFTPDKDNILTYKTKNAELGLVTYGFNYKKFPLCVKCPINELCNGGCLGSQYETNGDLFSPIKSVCENYFWLIKAIIDGMERIGVLDYIKDESMIRKPLIKQINFIQKLTLEKEGVNNI